MKYTAEQLMPVRAAAVKLRWRYELVWAFYNKGWHKVQACSLPDSQLVIPVPGAPEEVKPLAYPKHKPAEEGGYPVHLKDDDEWDVWWFDAEAKWGWDDFVDQFIPVRLDESEEDKTYSETVNEIIDGMLGETASIKEKVIAQLIEALNKSDHNDESEEDVSDVVWGTGKLLVMRIADGGVNLTPYPMISIDSVTIDVDEFTALCEHWLELQKKREPEILPCPNPNCDATKIYDDKPFIEQEESELFRVACNCGYRGPRDATREGAIQGHNLLVKNVQRKEK